MTNTPSKREMLRPLEYVMLAGLAALFAGLVVLMVTRDLGISVIVAGLVFVVVTIGIAMLVLAISPNATPEGEREAPGTGND